ncbi:hypothetical protein Fmac_004087 [Flemingia macrophylla]|uniref:Uncharacterized protein n=1 Tax=Flemingia macrophylla TaxID=520843 RepID=A0ABD1N3Y7_9FABA
METLRLIVISALLILGVLASTTGSAMGESSRKALRSRVQQEECDKAVIEINQSPGTPMQNGIPTYIVEIMNTCVSGCLVSEIHVDCGMFTSATLINPTIFKRLRYGDCLVNNGMPVPNGAIISFKYATTYSYPLSVSSLICIQP